MAAAALALTMTATAGVYAAVSMFRVDVTETEGTDQVKVRVEKDGEGQILPIKITANYLPEGYQEWEEGKYSLNGVFALDCDVGDIMEIVDLPHGAAKERPDDAV